VIAGIVGIVAALPGFIRGRPCPVHDLDGAAGGEETAAARPSADLVPSRYKDVTVPVGILYGTSDRIPDPAVHGKGLAAKVTNADLELVEGGGYTIPLTSADRASPFIERVAQRGAAAQS
jgi:pimeloyl-ACP methyl ester carboxylesterase